MSRCSYEDAKIISHLLKHADNVAPIILNAAIGDHLKTAVDDGPLNQIKSN